MKEMLNKLSKEIDEMNSVSKKVMKYGVELFLVLCFAGLMGSILNTYYFGNVESVANNSILIFKSSFSLLAIGLIGGIIMDLASKRG